MIYRQFSIGRFRGVADVTLSLIKGDLLLLLGLNESGKTTILRGIEAFDYRNDPSLDEDREKFYISVRNKSDLYTSEPAMVSARIELDEPLRKRDFKSLFRTLNSDDARLGESFLKKLNDLGAFTLIRVFPFRDGEPERPFYKFDVRHAYSDNPKLGHRLAGAIINQCPFIIYFEDFTDRIPEKIFVVETNDAFSPDWYDIIDGLFYHSNTSYSVKAFKALFARNGPRPDDAKTVLRRVNKTLNRIFTEKWKRLSGVEDIEDTELIASFHTRSKFFEIKVTDTDGTTYSVDERSKGALWYLSFLMKTEFRRKKIRMDSGKPIFLLDEPASNLHSTAQRNMLDDFRQLVEDTSVIYTSHSQYLVSLENVKNTYVIRRTKGTVSATLWSDYLKEDNSSATHYQPLANLLQLVPNSLDVPWPRAVITEGVTDYHSLLLAYRLIHEKFPNFVIYPGTGAYNLSTIISLNMGWQSDFRVLLDSDDAGAEAAANYKEQFSLDDEVIISLPKSRRTIEKYFDDSEKRALRAIALGAESGSRVSKKEFATTMAILSSRQGAEDEVRGVLGEATLGAFTTLFRRLGFE